VPDMCSVPGIGNARGHLKGRRDGPPEVKTRTAFPGRFPVLPVLCPGPPATGNPPSVTPAMLSSPDIQRRIAFSNSRWKAILSV
jgi:hypothetical protein